MMFVTKKAIPRRTVLRGMGASLALPLLDGMVPALTALGRSAAKPALRFGAVYVPNGMVMQNWTPAAAGTGFEFTPILQPLEPFRDRLTVLTGLETPRGSGGGPHARASTWFLTAEMPDRPETWNRKAVLSLDQRLADELRQHTPLASLEIGLEGANFAGSCSGDLSCSFSYTVSWRSASTPLPMEHNPRAVFERLFGDTESTDPAVRRARMREQRSILDAVSEDVARLSRRLGPSDRVKVGAYLDAVRDVERRIELAGRQDDDEAPTATRPLGVPASFAEHAALMYDLQLLAYQSDRTRVISFMIGHELSGRTYPEAGVFEAHHPLSHHKNIPETLAKLTKIQTYHTSLFANFLEKLRATPDGDGSLLDHVMIVYGAGFSDSNAHSPRNLPILLAGGGGGQVKGGQHLVYPNGAPLANLHVALLDKFGMPVERVSNSTGGLPRISTGERRERLVGV